MEDLFRSYWWLMFPLAWFVTAGLRGFLNYLRQRDTLDLIKTYASQGKEPPAALLDALRMPVDLTASQDWSGMASMRGSSRREGLYGDIQRLFLFGALATGFGFGAWWTDESHVRLAFSVVALSMGVVAVGSLLMIVVRLLTRSGGQTGK